MRFNTTIKTSLFIISSLFIHNVSAHIIHLTPLSDTLRNKDLDWFNQTDTILLRPVCGVNGKTYLNEQEALFNGINEWTKGRCRDYQKVSVEDPRKIWLTEISLNELTQQSDYEQSGHTNFTNVIFEVYHIQKNSFQYRTNEKISRGQQVMVWIDFNSNFQFESEELVIHEKGLTRSDSIEFTIPDHLESDFITQMRVFYGSEEEEPSNGFLSTGEIEDYTVMVGFE